MSQFNIPALEEALDEAGALWWPLRAPRAAPRMLIGIIAYKGRTWVVLPRTQPVTVKPLTHDERRIRETFAGAGIIAHIILDVNDALALLGIED
jgi:hypothetical protein